MSGTMMHREIWAAVTDAAMSAVEQRADLSQAAAGLAAGRGDRILLTTCHRVELYGAGQPDGEAAHLAGTRLLRGADAVRRLLSVAAGLESAVPGEDEVLRQVRDALAAAGPSLDPRLRRLFETAIATGRAARRHRRRPPDGLAQRAVAWLAGQADLRDRLLVVAGGGRVGTALAVAASRAGATVVVGSRDPAHARPAAETVGGRPASLREAADLAPDSAAVAVALGGPWRELVAAGRPLPPLADVSAPPAVSRSALARSQRVLSIDDLYDRAGDEAGYRAAASAVVDKHCVDFLSRRRPAA